MILENIINPKETIKTALKKLDQYKYKLLLVVDNNNKLLGTFSDGDARRLLLNGQSLKSDISSGYNQNCIFIKNEDFSEDFAVDLCRRNRILGVPIINAESCIVDFFSLQDHGKVEQESKKSLSTYPVIIMGGGKGTRMKPISDVFPKPLIPINGTPMIEHVIDYFNGYGVKRFYVTVNYKSQLIKSYFNGDAKSRSIDCIEEPMFMGTAGSLSLLDHLLEGNFIISNCDCLIKTDFSEAMDQHINEKADLTVITSIKHHQLPYGQIHYTNGGKITGIEEKPEFSIPINTGVYIAKDSVFSYIKKDQLFHMTHLIEALVKDNKKVSCFFVNENEFVDFGQWDEYKEAMDKLLQ